MYVVVVRRKLLPRDPSHPSGQRNRSRRAANGGKKVSAIAPERTAAGAPAPAIPSFLELEITGFCQLACVHCYADSGPHGGRGTMTTADWERVIDQAAAISVRMVQFIGGEPTLDPALPRLVRRALRNALKVYVYSNLVAPGQDIAQAAAELRRLGVTDIRIRPSRGVGRAARDGIGEDVAELCGNCGLDRAAILPDGQLSPCAIGRWLDCGNVRETPLAALLSGPAWQHTLALVPRHDVNACAPDCPPASDGNDCPPASCR
jgi:sulfatase maturation enzyme AslB (radical SAM superfamily)